MSELKSVGGYGLHVIRFPAGTFGFVGNVPMHLKYRMRHDGGAVPSELAYGINHCGPWLFRDKIKAIVWPTADAAVAEAEALGFHVDGVSA